jgi:ectoine hydroxylase-related dioxygenase (phytanoyl-CoA dioxygenase family)
VEQLTLKFRELGVVCVRGALDRKARELASVAYSWTLEHPGPGARNVLAGVAGAFFQDHANPQAFPIYRPLLCDTGLAGLVAAIMGSANLWFLYEQIWLKEGGETLPTPWHQDLPYMPMTGDHLATIWINLDPVPSERALEFVAGSHLGPLYNPTSFDPRDPRAAMFSDNAWPPLPDIEATRNAWPILSWDTGPADVLVFHPAILHGGAPTRAGTRRRSISLRVFGDEAYCAARPEHGLAQIDRLKCGSRMRDPIEEMAHREPGTLFRHPGFPQLVQGKAGAAATSQTQSEECGRSVNPWH